VRKFASKAMWDQRNQVSGHAVPGPTEIPASAIILTEGSGARMSELTPMFLAGPNANAMVLTTATDYGSLHSAGRPVRQ
jgi:hypothetical protein